MPVSLCLALTTPPALTTPLPSPDVHICTLLHAHRPSSGMPFAPAAFPGDCASKGDALLCSGGRGSWRQQGMREEDRSGSCWEHPKDVVLPLRPAADWVGGWWDHSPLVLRVMAHSAVPPREQPDGRYGHSGRHMPGGGGSGMPWPPQRLGGVPRR